MKQNKTKQIIVRTILMTHTLANDDVSNKQRGTANFMSELRAKYVSGTGSVPFASRSIRTFVMEIFVCSLISSIKLAKEIERIEQLINFHLRLRPIVSLLLI